MSIDNRKITSLIAGLLLAVFTFNPLTLSAAPLTGNLPDIPIFLETTVKANILTVIDDSGSMDFETMIAGADSGIYRPAGRTHWLEDYFYSYPISTEQLFPLCAWSVGAGSHCNSNTAPTAAYLGTLGGAQATAEQNLLWRFRNPDYNKMYYNHEVVYTPWSGSLDANITEVDHDIQIDSDGDGTNDNWYWVWWNGNFYQNPTFYMARYFNWVDTNGNGIVDEAYDANNLVEIKTGSNYVGGLERTDCATPMSCTYAEEIQNFANWFRYYRKRDWVTKRALSDILNSSQERVGLATLHNNNNVATAISDLTDTSSSPTNREQLLTNLFNINPNGGTPLRSTLEDAGEYIKSGGNLIAGAPSPILPAGSGGECQPNFTLLMTDGYWNGSDPSVGNRDKDGGTGDNNTSFDGGSHADDVSNTLADVAMKYYEIDLAPGLADQVPSLDDDNNSAQHMVTYGVSFGLSGAITSDPIDRATLPTPDWPDPVDPDTEDTIDDLRHAAWNGRGQFLSAANPQELIDGLENAFLNIEGRTGGASAVAFDEPVLNAGTQLFFSSFNSVGWSGDLLAFALDEDTGQLSSTPNWSADGQLASLITPPSDSRVILTHNDTQGVAFRWGNLSNDQQNDLKKGTGSAQNGVLPYLRGDTTHEGTQYRDRRGFRLGDIVRSSPVSVPINPDSWPNDAEHNTGVYADYNSYVNTTRAAVVYVGANDGMLHGFSSQTGQELLAYIPNSLFSTATKEGLHYLTDKKYVHRHYVDATPTVVDARIGSGSGASAWKTMLVGGLRAGGRGYFALDITNPSGFSEANANSIVQWEFTSDDDSDLGYTYSKASIIPAEDNNWYAVFGNGYNSDNGEAVLFMVRLNHSGGSWNLGADYYKLSVGGGNASNRNGLATPTVIDTDNDGKADRVYAGDLNGAMWTFDITTPSSITSRKVFQAQSNQSITSAPVIVRHPSEVAGGTSPNALVLFGTGQYLVKADATTAATQSFYGVWDKGSGTAATTSNLVEQTLSSFTTSGGDTVRLLTQNDVGYSTDSPATQGWYFNLGHAASGERVIAEPILRGNDIWFGTTVPVTTPCGDVGSGFLMVADARTGGSPPNPTFDANDDGVVDGQDLFFDSDGDGVPDGSVQDLIDNPQDLDGDGSVDTMADLDGDGSISVQEAVYQMNQLGVGDQLIAPVGMQQEGTTEGLNILGDYAFLTVLEQNLSGDDVDAGLGVDVTRLAPVSTDIVDRLSWEEL